MLGKVAEKKNEAKAKIKDIGMFLFLVSPLSIFLMGYEIGPYFICLMLLLALIIPFITILEWKNKDNDNDDEKNKNTFYFWTIEIGI